MKKFFDMKFRVKIYSGSYDHHFPEREMDADEVLDMLQSLKGKNFEVEVDGVVVQGLISNQVKLSFRAGHSLTESGRLELDKIIKKFNEI